MNTFFPFIKPEQAWDLLIEDLISILKEKRRHMRSGLTALGAEREVRTRRTLLRVRVAKVLKFEASR
jgi:hypothetical protein